ncbi:MAG: ABC transporter ATP-binding protein [Ruminococcaceae bacterium]|jgi:putative ABC transport system ATP-binding protein|nr:ABC transporter ATP-binding protein [Oscillospiraceae bacterium]
MSDAEKHNETIIFHTEGLCRQFQSGREIITVLDQINIQVRQQSLTMLKGRSGSGKTTLINLLGALDRPTSGKVFFKEEEISGLPDRRRDQLRRQNMGFVFQSVALITSMTAFENVEFALRVAGVESRGRSDRVEEVLDLVGLEKRMKHRTQELSGGEQQRVAIARAIAHRPTVVFADEPTAELDTNMGLQVVRLLRKMVEKEGLTVIMTTHDPNMIELADQVFSLDSGVMQND